MSVVSRLLGVVMVASLSVLVAPAAHAGEVLLDRTDEKGDVRIFKKNKGLRPSWRQSIDLRRSWVTEVDSRHYRFSVEIKRLAPKRTEWDQMVFFRARPKDKTKDNYVDIGFSHRDQGAYAWESRNEHWCDLEVTRRPAKEVMSVVVPLRCMPWDGWVMDVTTYAGYFRSDVPGYSRDRDWLGRFRY